MGTSGFYSVSSQRREQPVCRNGWTQASGRLLLPRLSLRLWLKATMNSSWSLAPFPSGTARTRARTRDSWEQGVEEWRLQVLT